MFVYGMSVMAEGLQQAAGAKTKKMLGILTSRRIMGVLVGALVTAIIQSSGATTVMVVGFVNAQLMSLQQAVGVIMGANIGTTMTAWLVSLSDWGAFLKPEMIAPLMLIIGVGCSMMLKSDRGKEASKILIGFGLLFMGLSVMTNAVSPYSESPVFIKAFEMIGGNPIIGLLVGMIVTAIMQSSSATMGILQILAMTGIVNWSSAVFIALGQNIGTCVVALISAVGADTNAKRAAMIHLEFNVIGSLLVGAAAWVYFMFNPATALMQVSSTNLAIFHTSFNIIATILLFPFANQLVALSKILIREHTSTAQEQENHLVRLDDRLLTQPAFALAAVNREIQYMGSLALENIRFSRDCLLENQNYELLYANEEKVNVFYSELMTFLEKLNTTTLTAQEQTQVKHTVLVLRDIEHVSDRTKEIANISKRYIDRKAFDETNVEDINTISSQSYKAFDYALKLRENRKPALIEKVNQYEQKVDNLEQLLRQGHLKREIKSTSNATTSLVFLEAVDCYERIADHAKLLAHYVAVEEGLESIALS
jgi:phosphate:Na+ symporter